jgi:serine/threonine-protein kinase RsbW
VKSLGFYSSSVPSKINCIRIVVEELISSLQRECGVLEESVLFELKVILNELLINAIRHGNMEDESKGVKINAGISVHGKLYIIIEDEGCGYDYVHTCDQLKPLCEETQTADIAESGRGIMILRGLCDKVKVNSKGNKVIVVKEIALNQSSSGH